MALPSVAKRGTRGSGQTGRKNQFLSTTAKVIIIVVSSGALPSFIQFILFAKRGAARNITDSS